jgi:hypothetical protein
MPRAAQANARPRRAARRATDARGGGRGKTEKEQIKVWAEIGASDRRPSAARIPRSAKADAAPALPSCGHPCPNLRAATGQNRSPPRFKRTAKLVA